jgi:SAM-dependent methyltransferase
MQADRIEWNHKYRQSAHPTQPASVLQAHARRASKGRALDVACGNGRNACYLAALGFSVDAVDIAEEGLNRFACPPAGIRRICADLDQFVVPPETYDLIVNIRYLNRRLFQALRDGLRPGGRLIFESYLADAARSPDGRHRPDHLLNPGELLRVFAGLQTIVYREHPSYQPDAPAMRATLVAVRPLRSRRPSVFPNPQAAP